MNPGSKTFLGIFGIFGFLDIFLLPKVDLKFTITPMLLMAGSARNGSLLLEAIVAIGIFAVFLGGIGMTLMVGERSTIRGGDRINASLIAEQALEGVRQLRNKGFSELTPGTYGVGHTGNSWTLGSAPITLQQGYVSQVEIVSLEPDWIEIRSRATWDFGIGRSGSVLLTSYLTDWRKEAVIGDWTQPSRIAEVTASATPEYQQIAAAGNYVYITSLNTAGGQGLYVFDVSVPQSPRRVSGSFDLGTSAYGLAIDGDRLYLATDNPAMEIMAYDISDPENLTADSFIKGFDLPGERRALSITFYDSAIFVGTIDTAPYDQFYSLLWDPINPIIQLDSLNLSGSINSLALQDGYAYAATSYNAGELQVVDVFDPADLVFAPGTGVDMYEVFDGNAVATFGTTVIIGRQNGSSIDEISVYSVAESPVPMPPPGPWSIEAGGNVLALATVFGGQHALIGTDNDGAQLKILDVGKLISGESGAVHSFDTEAELRGLWYDWLTDHLYGITPSSLIIFAPA